MTERPVSRNKSRGVLASENENAPAVVTVAQVERVGEDFMGNLMVLSSSGNN